MLIQFQELEQVRSRLSNFYLLLIVFMESIIPIPASFNILLDPVVEWQSVHMVPCLDHTSCQAEGVLKPFQWEASR